MRRIVIVGAIFALVLGAAVPANAATLKAPSIWLWVIPRLSVFGAPREDRLGYVPVLSRWAHASIVERDHLRPARCWSGSSSVFPGRPCL